MLREALQQRQREAGGLAGAGLRAGEHVAALEDRRDGLGLHGRGHRVALFGDGANEFGREAEISKRLSQTNLLYFGACGAEFAEREALARGRS